MFQTHVFEAVAPSVGLCVVHFIASIRLTIGRSQYQLVEHQVQQDVNIQTKYSKERLGRQEDAIAERVLFVGSCWFLDPSMGTDVTTAYGALYVYTPNPARSRTVMSSRPGESLWLNQKGSYRLPTLERISACPHEGGDGNLRDLVQRPWPTTPETPNLDDEASLAERVVLVAC